MALATASALSRFVHSNRAVVAMLALFVGLRAAAILFAVAPTSDAQWYYVHAAWLAEGRGYIDSHGAPTAYWPPGWPLALAAVFRLTGASIIAVGLANLVAATATALLLLDLARHVTGSELGARLALLLYTVYPNAILYVPLALTEVFYTLLLVGACWVLVVRRGPGWLIVGGIVLGLATLVKAQTLIIVPLVLGIDLVRSGPREQRLPDTLFRGVIVLAMAAVVVAPWTMRNHRLLGHWVAVSTNGGITLLTGNNDSARGTYTPDDPAVHALDARRDLDEVGYDAAARQAAVAWIRAHPARFALLAPLKVLRLWGPDGESLWAYETGSPFWPLAPHAFVALRGINQLVYFALMGAFLAAPWWLVPARRRLGLGALDWWLLPYAMAAYPSLIALVFSGQSRFHAPAMPFVCMIAGWLLAHWLCPPPRALENRQPPAHLV